MPGLPQVGVEAVVKGLGSFISDIGKVNDGIKSLDPTGNIITRTLEGVSGAFKNLGASMLRVAEVAIGVLVRDAFRAIIQGLGDIIRSTIEAGTAFQTMELRLNVLNFNTEKLTGNQQNYNAVMQEATELTREQLGWLQRIAVTTPYDAQDIANVFTLARSYGFASGEAKGLTQDITDFAAGMGLGNTEIERIIVNFGQMVQQGKVTQRELNDLARGSFVPVNDVLKQMQENLQMTDDEFEEFRYTAEGVTAFMEAFSDIVETRFSGAAEKMARTFQGATDNARDFIQSLVGFGIVRPVLNVIGGAIADVIDALTDPERWNALTAAAETVGSALSDVVAGIMGLAPDAGSLADSLVVGLENLGAWIDTHKDDIIGFFEDIRDTVLEVFDAVKNGDVKGILVALGVDEGSADKISGFIDNVLGIIGRVKAWFEENGPSIETFIEGIGDFIDNNLVPAFDTISQWVEDNGPTISEFFETLGEIIGEVFENLTGQEISGEGLQGFLDTVTSFMDYVIENKDKIAEWVTWLVKAWANLQVLGFVLTIVLVPLQALVGFLLSLTSVIAGLAAIWFILTSPITLTVVAVFLLIGALVWLYVEVQKFIEIIKFAGEVSGKWLRAQIEEMVPIVIQKFTELKTEVEKTIKNLQETINDKIEAIKTAFIDTPWGAIGRAIIEGVAAGVRKAADMLVQAALSAANAAIEAVENALGIQSPSKVFFGFGENMMEGMALGIDRFAGMAAKSMQEAVAGVQMPAMVASAQMGGAVSTQNNYTNNYNLTVNSSAMPEPLIQDYNMMKSLAGA